ncbi:MAG: AAA family ATPase, partial [bacterium]|nr:AAA family ATPase [bacterium]
MLKRLAIRGFKSLEDVVLEVPCLTVLFGPNAAGKSNVLDAVQMLSRSVGCRTLAEALTTPIRGYPIEAFAFPQGGLPQLLSQPFACFSLEADLTAGPEAYRYRLGAGIEPDSGKLFLTDEYLGSLTPQGEPKGPPSIEVVAGQIRLRGKSKASKPRYEPLREGFSILSDPRLGGAEYPAIERTREKLSGWRTYYLDPRVAMRTAQPLSDVHDIGVLGEAIGPFLYRLRSDRPRHFAAVRRTLRSI